MIIVRTPFRISFAGGGSDLSDFYERHEGCVVSTSINKYMYITIHPSFNRENTLLKYKKTEQVTDVKQIEHPIARQILSDQGISGVEITSVADVPAGTGLGSSSAYTVGLLHAVNAYKGKYRSQERLAREACNVEIDKLGDPIGKQDQYGCAIGGIKFIRFLKNGEVDVSPILLNGADTKRLENNLLMFYTGDVRTAAGILKEQKANTQQKDTFDHLVKMTELAHELRDSLQNGRIERVGEILHKGWVLKRTLASNISNHRIDQYYQSALDAGASGGKLLGAGGGGFLLLYCEEEKQEQVRLAMSDLEEMKFSFDNAGTKIVYIGEKDW